jgi:hypothetical protein
MTELKTMSGSYGSEVEKMNAMVDGKNTLVSSGVLRLLHSFRVYLSTEQKEWSEWQGIKRANSGTGCSVAQ